MAEILSNIPDQDRAKILARVHKLPAHQQAEMLALIDELDRRQAAEKRRLSLLEFIVYIDPTYKIGIHHRKLAKLLESMAAGRLDRMTVSIAPRFGKSMMVSIYFQAWYIGNYPDKKLMLVSHTADLAVDFGRKVRNLMATDAYKSVFPGVELAADSKSAGRWNTNKGGEFFAVGIGGAIAGRGADLLIIDDAHNEQDILKGNYEVFEQAYDWYTYGARTRLMPQGRVAIIGTRWAKNDLIGKVIQDMTRNPDGDQWEVVEFPAILNGKSLWPEQWPLEVLLKTKAVTPAFQWNAQYMQNPTNAESSIIQRDWWKPWEKDEPPDCEFVIMSLDAAAEEHNRADFTSISTWGVFYMDKDSPETSARVILLNAIKVRVEFPELKKLAYREYAEWEPDWFVVEKKSAGTQLYQELRAAGVPVQEITPHRGTGDKTVRLNGVSDIFSAGFVYYPVGRRWAEELVDEVCGFPSYGNDDQVDTTIYALWRFRSGGFIKLPTDKYDDEPFVPVRRKAYY